MLSIDSHRDSWRVDRPERPEEGELADPLARRDRGRSRGSRCRRTASPPASRGRGRRSARGARGPSRGCGSARLGRSPALVPASGRAQGSKDRGLAFPARPSATTRRPGASGPSARNADDVESREVDEERMDLAGSNGANRSVTPTIRDPRAAGPGSRSRARRRRPRLSGRGTPRDHRAEDRGRPRGPGLSRNVGPGPEAAEDRLALADADRFGEAGRRGVVAGRPRRRSMPCPARRCRRDRDRRPAAVAGRRIGGLDAVTSARPEDRRSASIARRSSSSIAFDRERSGVGRSPPAAGSTRSATTLTVRPARSLLGAREQPSPARSGTGGHRRRAAPARPAGRRRPAGSCRRRPVGSASNAASTVSASRTRRRRGARPSGRDAARSQRRRAPSSGPPSAAGWRRDPAAGRPDRSRPASPSRTSARRRTGDAQAARPRDPRDRPVARSGRPGRRAASNRSATRPDVGGGPVGRLVRLRAGPRRGVGGGERPERGCQHQQQRRPRVAERAPGELAAAERADEAAAANEEPLRRARRSGARPGARARRPPTRPIAGRRDEQRVQPERARGRCGSGARRTGGAARAPRRPRPRGPGRGPSRWASRRPRLAALRRPARRPGAGRLGKGREGRARDAGQSGDRRHDDRVLPDRGVAGQPEAGRWPDDPEQAHDADRQERREDGRRDGEDGSLEERHGDQVDAARAARSHQGDLGPAALHEHPGHQDHRVAGEDRELDRQQDRPRSG